MKLILSDKTLQIPLPFSPDTQWIDLSKLKISNCIGCFGCWTKTPGKCVIRDDATQVYPLIAQSDTVMYISRIKYGGYDTIMKTMLERAIPIQQAFIHIADGETHHVQRNVARKKAIIIAYGADSEAEQSLFRQLVDRNARNMNFESFRVVFCPEDGLNDMVCKEISEWKKS